MDKRMNLLRSFPGRIAKMVLVLAFWVLGLVQQGYTQSCYVQLADMSGVDVQPYQADLNQADVHPQHAKMPKC